MIPYLFISGFLGAGKTTLLNNLLKRYAHLKIGVIVNDFGELAVDNMLIDKKGVTGEILELRAGQIFCSCLSGQFVDSVLAYESIQPDLLLVECSGLAKPATLSDIVAVINKKAPDCFAYAGMVSLIDGTRHEVLEQSLMVVTEQIEASDLLLISKTDQLEPQKGQQLQDHLEKQYPEKIILSIPKDTVELDLVALLKGKRKAFAQVDASKHAGWGELGRPVTFTLTPEMLSSSEIESILRPFQNRWYRLKGTLATSDSGPRYFDGVLDYLDVLDSSCDEYGLVVITHDHGLEAELKSAFGLQPPSQPLQPIGLPVF